MTAAFPETGRLAAWAELAGRSLAQRGLSLDVGTFGDDTSPLAALPTAWAELADGSLAPTWTRCPVSRRRRRRKQQKKLEITQIHAIISDNPTIFTAKYAKSQKKINYRLFGSSFSVKQKKISSNCSLRRKSTALGDRRSSARDPQPRRPTSLRWRPSADHKITIRRDPTSNRKPQSIGSPLLTGRGGPDPTAAPGPQRMADKLAASAKPRSRRPAAEQSVKNGVKKSAPLPALSSRKGRSMQFAVTDLCI